MNQWERQTFETEFQALFNEIETVSSDTDAYLAFQQSRYQSWVGQLIQQWLATSNQN